MEFSALSFSYIQMHFSHFGIPSNVPSLICISHNQGVPVFLNSSFVFPCFVIPSRMFLVLSVSVLRRYHSVEWRGTFDKESVRGARLLQWVTASVPIWRTPYGVAFKGRPEGPFQGLSSEVKHCHLIFPFHSVQNKIA